jgi:long-subunit fatty acid transport protein
MKNTLIGAGIAALAATSVSAGGIERASNDYGVLFGEGTQLSFGVSFVNPNVSGDYPAALGGGSTGNMSESYVTVSAAYKMDLGENLSFGLFRNNGYGADASYTQGIYTGLRARWESDQTALVLKYQIGDRISVYGGARYVKSTAEIAIPELLVRGSVGDYATELGTQAAAAAGAGDLASAGALGAEATRLGTAANPLSNPLGNPGMNYTASGSSGDWGYVVGAAYEIPDIALRVALTYESSIEHAFSTTESLATLGIPASGTTKVTLPQSVSLDFQTGVAPGTLVFGKIKWAEWSKWEVRTPGYESVTGGEVTGLDNDTITYNLGVGRQFNENMSGFAQVSYEKSNGGVASRLAPTDGSFSFGVGGQYSKDNMKVRGGVQYVKLGDATDGSGVQFTGNSAIGFGMQVSFSF